MPEQSNSPEGGSPSEADNHSSDPGHGCSKPRPVVLGGAPRNGSWHYGRAVVLRELHRALDRYTTREADAVFSRASWEMSRDYPSGWAVSVNWAYWIARFPGFSPAQRRFHLHRDIIPILKSKVAVTPSEPRRFCQGSSISREPVKLAQTLDPFLARFLQKFTK